MNSETYVELGDVRKILYDCGLTIEEVRLNNENADCVNGDKIVTNSKLLSPLSFYGDANIHSEECHINKMFISTKNFIREYESFPYLFGPSSLIETRTIELQISAPEKCNTNSVLLSTSNELLNHDIQYLIKVPGKKCLISGVRIDLYQKEQSLIELKETLKKVQGFSEFVENCYAAEMKIKNDELVNMLAKMGIIV